MLTNDILSHLYKLAANSPTKEICGIITEDLSIVSITNVASSNSQFIMDKREFFKALNVLKEENRKVLAIYHSHPSGDVEPSEADVNASKRTGYNYLIVTPQQQYKWVEL